MIYRKPDKAEDLMDLVGRNVCRMGGNEAVGHAMRDAVALAIGTQMVWTVGDVGHFAGTDRDYALAIIVNNMSYLRAHEKYHNMAPYFGNCVRFPDYAHCGYVHMVGERARSRLCVGAFVVVPDVGRAEVTSMTPERIILTVSAYEEGANRFVVKRRIKLTHEQCAKMFPAPKNARSNSA